MKRNMYLGALLVLFFMFVVGARAFGAPALYDDFSDTYIDNGKWDAREFVREVAEGQLVSKIGSSTFNSHARNNTPFENPSSIYAIQCDITIVATTLDTGTSARSFARIDGRFYNTKNSGTQEGDVWAGVYIGDRGNGGLEAWWEIVESLNDLGNSWADIGQGTLIGPDPPEPDDGLTTGIAYTTKIEYNAANTYKASGCQG
jgi:hypothetical protein